MTNPLGANGPAPEQPGAPRASQSSLGVLSPLLGGIQCASLLLLVLLLWLFQIGYIIPSLLLVPCLLLVFIPYFIAVYTLAHPQSFATVRAILFFAILFRMILWASPPVLSDDVYRYVWEGRAQLHGFNPYVHAPDDWALQHLRDQDWEGINHKAVPAIYPPFAQMLFVPLALLPWPVGMTKLFFGGLDVLNVWLLIRILRAKRLPHQFALIYAWNPLPALEFAGSGLLLSAAIALFLGAYLLVERNRHAPAAIVSGLAMGTHFLVLAPLLHAYNVLQKRWLPIVAIVLGILYLPYLWAGPQLFDGLSHYAAVWKFNDSFFAALAWVFRDSHRVFLPSGVYLTHLWPKLIVLAIWGGAALWFIFQEKEWLRAGYMMTGLTLLLSATVHPWYVTLMLPFLCFYRNLGWLAFTALVTISYTAVVIAGLTGGWPAITLVPLDQGLELTFVGWLEYAPFFVLLLWSVVKTERRTG